MKKQQDRAAFEEKIELYSHNNGRIGVIVEINTETEFDCRTDTFQNFVHEIALQITSAGRLVDQVIGQLGENIVAGRFTRWEINLEDTLLGA